MATSTVSPFVKGASLGLLQFSAEIFGSGPG